MNNTEKTIVAYGAAQVLRAARIAAMNDQERLEYEIWQSIRFPWYLNIYLWGVSIIGSGLLLLANVAPQTATVPLYCLGGLIVLILLWRRAYARNQFGVLCAAYDQRQAQAQAQQSAALNQVARDNIHQVRSALLDLGWTEEDLVSINQAMQLRPAGITQDAPALFRFALDLLNARPR